MLSRRISARIVQQSLAIFGEARGPSVALENRLAELFVSRFICIETADWVLWTTSRHG